MQKILKSLEKNDIARGKLQVEIAGIEEEPQVRALTEVEQMLADTDLNILSPMQALLLLSDLKEKLETEKE